jgi:carboxyl-terminal processing protease
MVRGRVGEPVTLTLLEPGGESARDVTIQRTIITVESVLGDVHDDQGRWNFLINDDPRIGYVRIIKFGDKTAAELAAVLADLKRDGLDGLVLDLRDDAGGALDAAVEVSDLFLPAGRPIVTTRGRDQQVRDRYLSSGGGYTDLPLAVIVDRNSASASEIVAACLQDYGRAEIVGERSYGKGTVQRLMRVESGRSLLKLTSATYWRPSGKNIHRMPGDDNTKEWGVSPDEGLQIDVDRDEYRMWRDYRVRRDLIGDDIDSKLAVELDLADGKIPSDFEDRPRRRAVDCLEDRLKPQNLPAPRT